ncbi:isochorismate synthase DhbC [Chitinimonas arctica]|uniref:isochorismate synthase n=1 Tax=Chitinimonas arctica TaxID=2594795 RepID=A0A516SK10_9NEIS|nr:isochorismate synthase DhbC [Chitinimonas arctica]QDQ28492.1 isochorismate synthase DhbC [Chitinimonas arctica]
MNDRLRETQTTPIGLAELLAQYQPGSTLFASPRRSLLAHGIEAVLPACRKDQLAARAAAMLEEARKHSWHLPVLMGAVPFQADAPARLVLPGQVYLGAGAAGQVLQTVAMPVSAKGMPAVLRMEPTPDEYRRNVALALSRIAENDMEKVVLSRSLTLAASVDVATLLQRLASRNAHGYTFAVDLPGMAGERRTLLGASPELLLARHGREVSSHPLAGSIPRSADPVEDQRRAQGLLQSEKDLHEHALVVDAVADALRPYCRGLHVPAAPSLVATPTMWHLGTEVRGELDDPATSSLTLALALHPTPAVCGHPTQAAHRFIDEQEGFDRSFFTGLVGWCDANGDGEWAVTIRCAEVGEQTATLYAGAGVVAGSDPELELRETAGKLRTMLNAMGLEMIELDKNLGDLVGAVEQGA